MNDDTVRDYPKRAQTTATPTIARSLTFSKYKSRSHREHVRPSAALPTAPSTTTSDGKWQYAAPNQDVTLLLTESGSDVAIRISLPTYQGLCPHKLF